MGKRQDEHTKLTAAAINNVGVGTIVTGFVVPELALSADKSRYLPYLAFALGIALILMARCMLEQLSDD